MQNGQTKLAASHVRAFAEWVSHDFDRQRAEVVEYVGTLPVEVAKAWSRAEAYEGLIPEAADPVEKRLYLCTVQALLPLVVAVCGSRSVDGATDALNLARFQNVVEIATARHGDIELTLKDISRRIDLSERYLSSVFISQTGMHFRSYLKALRLRRAVDLLKNTPLTAQQVAAEIGYRDPSNFGHDFRVTFGATPRSLRAHYVTRVRAQIAAPEILTFHQY